jgi:hypothetical protein
MLQGTDGTFRKATQVKPAAHVPPVLKTPITTHSTPTTSEVRRSAPSAKLKAASRLISPAHLKSVHEATKAFKNFSLSRFPKDAAPPNYVDRLKVKDPAAVQTLQKQLITQQLEKLPETDAQNTGMTLAFPREKLDAIKKSLPGIEDDGGVIELGDLLKYIRGKMNGTDLYSRGNPVLSRLTAETKFRSQARAIIDRIKNGAGAAEACASEAAPSTQSTPRSQLPQRKKEGPKA